MENKPQESETSSLLLNNFVSLCRPALVCHLGKDSDVPAQLSQHWSPSECDTELELR